MSRDFYIRQLWDGKGSALVELMDPTAHARSTPSSAARRSRKAHARSGDADRDRRLPRRAATRFDRAMASFAELYADQNERDYDAVRAAVASGRVAAQTDL